MLRSNVILVVCIGCKTQDIFLGWNCIMKKYNFYSCLLLKVQRNSEKLLWKEFGRCYAFACRKIPELFLQRTAQCVCFTCEMKITLSKYEASLHKQWLSHEVTCRRLTMMPLKYWVPDTALFYKNRALTVIVQLEMTLSAALQDDFLTLDWSKAIRRDSRMWVYSKG